MDVIVILPPCSWAGPWSGCPSAAPQPRDRLPFEALGPPTPRGAPILLLICGTRLWLGPTRPAVLRRLTTSLREIRNNLKLASVPGCPWA